MTDIPDLDLGEPENVPTLLDAALAYAAQGLPVLPCEPRGKVPLVAGGFKSAATDAETIRGWWARWPAANVAIPTGGTSGFVVLDVDVPAGLRSLGKLERKHGTIRSAQVLTGSGGWHHWFLDPGVELRNSAGALGDGLDIRRAGGFAVVPPSVHESGRMYKWTRELAHATAMPEWLLVDATTRRNGPAPAAEATIPAGRRNHELASIAGTLRRRALDESEILAKLREVNRRRCKPPLDDDELLRITKSIAQYEPAEQLGTPAYTGPSRSLDEVVDAFSSRLHLPDPAPLQLMLATVVANEMDEGDPVWLVIVGGSSRGKTEQLLALDGRPGVRITGAITVASLLSGTARRDRAKGATGGVLAEIGDRGSLVVKDLGAVMSLHREARAQVFQALRDIYDGRYTRDVGVDGGRKLEWSGRLGLIAGATSALDQAHAMHAALGERWITVRIPDGGDRKMTKIALRSSDTRAMRAELRDAVQGFLESVGPVALRPLSEEEEAVIVALAPLVCHARSPVDRDPYHRDIVLVHQPEGPARIARQLHKLYVVLEAFGVPPAGVIVKTGLDSIPSPRREALLHLLRHGECSTTKTATAIGLPSTEHRTQPRRVDRTRARVTAQGRRG